MTLKTFKPGALFYIPLLRGGFSIGYVTGEPGQTDYILTNICALVLEECTLPFAIEKVPVAIRDLITRRANFSEKFSEKPWVLTRHVLSEAVLPEDRYTVFGDTVSRLFDMSGVEPPIRIEPPATDRYRRLEGAAGLKATAVVEVAVRNLSIAPRDLVEEYESLPANTQPVATKTEASPSVDQLGPFQLVRFGADEFSLIWSDSSFNRHESLFRSKGMDCNGYSWTKIISSLVHSKDPEIARRLAFDPEAGTVVIRGPVSALSVVAGLTKSLLASKPALKKAIQRSST